MSRFLLNIAKRSLLRFLRRWLGEFAGRHVALEVAYEPSVEEAFGHFLHRAALSKVIRRTFGRRLQVGSAASWPSKLRTRGRRTATSPPWKPILPLVMPQR